MSKTEIKVISESRPSKKGLKKRQIVEITTHDDGHKTTVTKHQVATRFGDWQDKK